MITDDQWKLWTFVCHPHTCFLTVAGNNFKVKVKSITKFQFDSTYSRANRSRGLALLSPVSFATVERENETHRWMSDVDLSSTIMMTHQKSFFSPQISSFSETVMKVWKLLFGFMCKSMLLFMLFTWCIFQHALKWSINHFTQFVICIIMNMQRI